MTDMDLLSAVTSHYEWRVQLLQRFENGEDFFKKIIIGDET
jgi:hypothetical protein